MTVFGTRVVFEGHLAQHHQEFVLRQEGFALQLSHFSFFLVVLFLEQYIFGLKIVLLLIPWMDQSDGVLQFLRVQKQGYDTRQESHFDHCSRRHPKRFFLRHFFPVPTFPVFLPDGQQLHEEPVEVFFLLLKDGECSVLQDLLDERLSQVRDSADDIIVFLHEEFVEHQHDGVMLDWLQGLG